MTETALLAVVLAAAAGLLAGRAWRAARLRDEATSGAFRASPHYAQALHSLAAGRLDLALSELEKVAREEPDAFDVQLVLGHLLRETGHVERAMQTHQALLARDAPGRGQRAQALVGLGQDQRAAGFIDRATRTFEDVLDAEPRNLHALEGLARIHEDQRRWHAAYEARARLQRLRKSDDSLVLGYLQAEVGLEALLAQRRDEAERAFRTALRLDARVFPAYLGLADLSLDGEPRRAASILEEAVAAAPERAYLAFDRLARAFDACGEPSRFVELCEDIVRRDPRDWRARVALARHLRAAGRPEEAHGLLLRAVTANPHVLLVHLETWRTLRALGVADPRVAEYDATCQEAVFYRDPHVCTRCRYRADDMLWRCPHCHEWNSFVEERVGPAAEG
ncbi:MAG TPA: tetratricopeptide repeat protein [Vicinamibacteria bacterium]|nr:tetratricopeptide repeat protein [Vicinamibacteria bacterium]